MNFRELKKDLRQGIKYSDIDNPPTLYRKEGEAEIEGGDYIFLFKYEISTGVIDDGSGYHGEFGATEVWLTPCFRGYSTLELMNISDIHSNRDDYKNELSEDQISELCGIFEKWVEV